MSGQPTTQLARKGEAKERRWITSIEPRQVRMIASVRGNANKNNRRQAAVGVATWGNGGNCVWVDGEARLAMDVGGEGKEADGGNLRWARRWKEVVGEAVGEVVGEAVGDAVEEGWRGLERELKIELKRELGREFERREWWSTMESRRCSAQCVDWTLCTVYSAHTRKRLNHNTRSTSYPEYEWQGTKRLGVSFSCTSFSLQHQSIQAIIFDMHYTFLYN
jgi:hypothetical protein